MADTRDTRQVPAAVHPEDPDAAIAWWTVAPGRGEFRSEALPALAEGEALVRALWTGVSRGTEGVVARGEVPASERERMRAPFQAGEFPFPVKYGYLSVGVVERGPSELRDATVFSLFPHQSRYVLPVTSLHPLPDAVPPRRAVLAGAVETAVNVLWDAAPRVGDRVTVVGGGMIGGAIARVARGIPGVKVTVVDVDPGKAAIAKALDVGFAVPAAAPRAADVVIEASGTVDGLQLALSLAPTDGEVVVASWYGDRPLPLVLGGDFHARRLTLRSSQVGEVSSSRRSRRTTHDRLSLALRLLEDAAFDALLGGTSSWRQLPEVTAALADGTAGALCHTIDWGAPTGAPADGKEST